LVKLDHCNNPSDTYDSYHDYSGIHHDVGEGRDNKYVAHPMARLVELDYCNNSSDNYDPY
jgi:hypothetical protein